MGDRKRGVRLSDLDRRHMHVIGYTGRRWEVLGVLLDPNAIGPLPEQAPAADRASGARGEPAEPAPGRHAAPAPEADPGPIDPWKP